VSANRSFRWDIQGLRAIAVLAVVIFHIDPQLLPGGYIGVDIFFVISGYLIIGFIHRDLIQGEFSLSRFYVKRVYRLFPALFVMVAVSTVFAYWILLPDEARNYLYSLASTLFYYSNFYFYSQADYFNTAMKFAPLLHTWSLSVEEQFYLVFPVILIWIYYKRWSTVFVLGLIGLLSFGLSILLIDKDPAFAFFASPTRFFQFIVGGVIAVALQQKRPSAIWSDLLVLTGMVLSIVPMFLYDETTPFPGLYALVPTLGAGLIVFAGARMYYLRPLLENVIFKYIGNASYSIYLWHWPLIVYYKLKFSPNLSSLEEWMLFTLSLLLGFLSWMFIEQRTRLKSTQSITLRPLAGVAAGSILFTSVSVAFFHFVPSGHIEYRHKAYQYLNHVAEGMRAGECFLTSKYNDVKFYQKEKCVTYEEGKKNYLLIGDSHAAHYYRALHEMLDENETLTQVTSSGCPPVIPFRGAKKCYDLHSWAFNDLIREKHFDTIIISANWYYVWLKHKTDIKKTIEELLKYTDRVVILGPSMQYSQSLPRLLVELPEDANSSTLCYTAGKYKFFSIIDRQMRAFLKMDGVVYISTFDALCDGKGCCTVTPEGVPVNFDEDHLTYEGAHYILKKYEKQIFDR
jgi:peptidoglycan/LPS O-acetylase OafA/YrhL